MIGGQLVPRCWIGMLLLILTVSQAAVREAHAADRHKNCSLDRLICSINESYRFAQAQPKDKSGPDTKKELPPPSSKDLNLQSNPSNKGVIISCPGVNDCACPAHGCSPTCCGKQ